VAGFQASYPDVRVRVTISDREEDFSADDFDLSVNVGPMEESARMSRRILIFRDQLVASPTYLKTCKAPKAPGDLLGHRLLASSSMEPAIEWTLLHTDDRNGITLAIEPCLSVNDPASLVDAVLAGMGIGNLPSMVVGELIKKGRLIELIPQWHFGALEVSVANAGNCHVRWPVQAFTSFAAKFAPALFPHVLSSNRRDTRRRPHRRSGAPTIPEHETGAVAQSDLSDKSAARPAA
jgi:DNA-binding transcriptional LysR family regulator